MTTPLLIEKGADPETAIREVRRARPGTIETAAQEAYVRGYAPARARGEEGEPRLVLSLWPQGTPWRGPEQREEIGPDH